MNYLLGSLGEHVLQPSKHNVNVDYVEEEGHEFPTLQKIYRLKISSKKPKFRAEIGSDILIPVEIGRSGGRNEFYVQSTRLRRSIWLF